MLALYAEVLRQNSSSEDRLWWEHTYYSEISMAFFYICENGRYIFTILVFVTFYEKKYGSLVFNTIKFGGTKHLVRYDKKFIYLFFDKVADVSILKGNPFPLCVNLS